MASILLPAFTFARWGGLHEFVVDAVRTLTSAGHEVTAVVKNDPIANRIREVGGNVELVDWDSWEGHAKIIARRKRYDLVFAQPFRSRQLGLAVSRLQHVPLVTMIHGYNPDHAYVWQDECVGFFATTDSIAELLQDLCRVPSNKITVVPNSVANDRFNLPVLSYADKTLDGKAVVTVVSRIDKDKRSQVDVVKQLIPLLEEDERGLRWTIQFLGDGLERERVEEELLRQTSSTRNVDIEFKGWTDPEKVPGELARSLLSVSAGRGAMQSLAVGTPCFAAGAKGVGGLQAGAHLNIGLRSNFADYPLDTDRLTEVSSDFRMIMDPDIYSRVQSAGRKIMWQERSQDAVEKLLLTTVESYL